MTSDPRRAPLVPERLDAIRRLLRERGEAAALLGSRATFAWVTAGGENHVVLASETGVASLLVTPTTAVVLTAVNEAPRVADEELAGLGLEVIAVPWHDADAVAREARRIAGTDPMPEPALADAVLPLRFELADLEQERMAWLAERAVAAMRDALGAAEPGRSEHEIGALALRSLGAAGVRAPVLLVAADDRIARYRHPLPSERPVRRRAMVVVVAERWGLHVALTRFAELEPPDDDLRRRIEAAERVHDAMVAATRPGTTLGDVLDAARAAYAAEGYADEWELHHQGGIIGYQGRERIAVPGDRTPIHTNTAFAWNPSIAGAKAEQTIFLTGSGVRTLTA